MNPRPFSLDSVCSERTTAPAYEKYTVALLGCTLGTGAKRVTQWNEQADMALGFCRPNTMA